MRASVEQGGLIRRFAAFLFVGSLSCLVACEQAETPEGETEPAVPISGRYEVSGETVTKSTGEKRGISGTVIVATDDSGGYTATFDLTTTFPGADSAMPAEVIGKGEGTVEGRTLRGTTETQLVMATVPGVDPGFAYIPRMVSTRIVSNTAATMARDGTVSITIRSVPAEGEQYEPTRSILHGRRVSSSGIGGR